MTAWYTSRRSYDDEKITRQDAKRGHVSITRFVLLVLDWIRSRGSAGSEAGSERVGRILHRLMERSKRTRLSFSLVRFRDRIFHQHRLTMQWIRRVWWQCLNENRFVLSDEGSSVIQLSKLVQSRSDHLKRAHFAIARNDRGSFDNGGGHTRARLPSSSSGISLARTCQLPGSRIPPGRSSTHDPAAW